MRKIDERTQISYNSSGGKPPSIMTIVCGVIVAEALFELAMQAVKGDVPMWLFLLVLLGVIGIVVWKHITQMKNDKDKSENETLTAYWATDDGKKSAKALPKVHNAIVYQLLTDVRSLENEPTKVKALIDEHHDAGVFLPRNLDTVWRIYNGIPREHEKVKQQAFKAFIDDAIDAMTKYEKSNTFGSPKRGRMYRPVRLWCAIMWWCAAMSAVLAIISKVTLSVSLSVSMVSNALSVLVSVAGIVYAILALTRIVPLAKAQAAAKKANDGSGRRRVNKPQNGKQSKHNKRG
jgi:hypothetical protein